MAKKKVTKKAGVVKKKWYKINAPVVFGSVQVGETHLADPEKAVGRKMRVNLMTLTGEPQKQNITVRLRITGLKDNVFNTALESYRMLPAAMKKLVRRNREKVDDSVVLKTKDNVVVRVKPIVVTRGKTTNSVTMAIRKFVRAQLASHLARTEFDAFVKEVMARQLQQSLQRPLKKFHPISVTEIRAFEIVPERKLKAVKILQPAKEAVPAEA